MGPEFESLKVHHPKRGKNNDFCLFFHNILRFFAVVLAAPHIIFPQISPKTKIPFSALPPHCGSFYLPQGRSSMSCTVSLPHCRGRTPGDRNAAANTTSLHGGEIRTSTRPRRRHRRGELHRAPPFSLGENDTQPSLLNRPSPPGMTILSIRLHFVQTKPARSRAGSFLLLQ